MPAPTLPVLISREVCKSLAGDPDLYGVGIRIGIYLQWISSLFTNLLIPSGVSDALDTNSIFLLAVFIAIANATKSSGTEPLLGPIGAFVMLQMLFGYLLSVMSISGLRITILSDPESIDVDALTAKFTELPSFAKASPIKKAALNELSQTSIGEVPQGLEIRKSDLIMFRALDMLAMISCCHDLQSNSTFFSAWTMNEPILWLIDLWVFIALRLQTDASKNPVKEYKKARLRNYQAIRTLAQRVLGAQVFSLGMSSAYKQDQVSWLGVCWRSLLVGGVAIYNIWYWFTGVGYLHADQCDMYIFLFAKVSILGPARTCFKIFSIVYAIYAGLFLIVCLYAMLAFYQTFIRSCIINFLIMPYAKFLLFCASAGSTKAKAVLDEFDTTQLAFLKWLEIPTIRQTLCGFAFLCSSPVQLSSEDRKRKDNVGSSPKKKARYQNISSCSYVSFCNLALTESCTDSTYSELLSF